MSDPRYFLSILRMRKLRERIGLSVAQVYAMLDPKSPSYDPTFPIQVRLSASAVGWLEHEVEEWLEARIKLSRGEHGSEPGPEQPGAILNAKFAEVAVAARRQSKERA